MLGPTDPVGHSRALLIMRTFLYTIHPNARALSLASFQARSRNSAWVSGTRLSSFVGKFFKPRGGCRLVVRDGVGRERQGDDDLVFQNFHVKFAPRVGHRFLNFTPGASPLVNATPAHSRVRRIAASVSGAPAYAPVSILLTMSRSTPERSARSRTVQSSNPRAALICALVTSASPGRPNASLIGGPWPGVFVHCNNYQLGHCAVHHNIIYGLLYATFPHNPERQ